jgi:hypothetical protein
VKLANVAHGAGNRCSRNTFIRLYAGPKIRFFFGAYLPLLARSSGSSVPKRGTTVKADRVWKEPYQAAILETDDGSCKTAFTQQRRRLTPDFTNCSKTVGVRQKKGRLSAMRFLI